MNELFFSRKKLFLEESFWRGELLEGRAFGGELFGKKE
jgi:hypothetical protein